MTEETAKRAIDEGLLKLGARAIRMADRYFKPYNLEGRRNATFSSKNKVNVRPKADSAQPPPKRTELPVAFVRARRAGSLLRIIIEEIPR